MLEQIPDEKAMVALLGQSLYDLWTQLCLLIDEKYDMEHLWNSGGRAGLMNTNTVVVEKRCVHFMREKIAWASWSFWERANGKNLKWSGRIFLKNVARLMMVRKPITMANGSCLNQRMTPCLVTLSNY